MLAEKQGLHLHYLSFTYMQLRKIRIPTVNASHYKKQQPCKMLFNPCLQQLQSQTECRSRFLKTCKFEPKLSLMLNYTQNSYAIKQQIYYVTNNLLLFLMPTKKDKYFFNNTTEAG